MLVSLIETFYPQKNRFASLFHRLQSRSQFFAFFTTIFHILIIFLFAFPVPTHTFSLTLRCRRFPIPLLNQFYLKRLQLVCIFQRSSIIALFQNSPNWYDLNRTRKGLLFPSPIFVQNIVPVWLADIFCKLIRQLYCRVHQKQLDREKYIHRFYFAELFNMQLLMRLGINSFGHIPVLYANDCPQQPLILYQQSQEPKKPQSKAFRVSKSYQQKMSYKPRIIPSRKMWATGASWYEQLEHLRQLASLQKRIKNVKSLSQRKKDHNDPILYPSYFVRQKKKDKDARIDGYYKQLLQKNSDKIVRRNVNNKNKEISTEEADYRPQTKQQQQQQVNISVKKISYISVQQDIVPLPIVQLRQNTNQGIYSSKNVPNLPGCGIQQLINFIMTKGIFTSKDLNILRARMAHYYGENSVHLIWGQAISILLSRRNQ